MRINEKVFAEAFVGASMDSKRDARDYVTTYLAYLESALHAPEEKRDRIAVVVDAAGEFSCWNVDEEDVDNAEMWDSLEDDAKRRADAHPPFARAIVRCNLPRPVEPIEVDGEVER